MQTLTQTEIEQFIQNDLQGWELKDGKISRQFELSSFKDALAFVNKVGDLAEAAAHHPDIHVYYRKVLLELTTHDAGGITMKDIDLAKQISQL